MDNKDFYKELIHRYVTNQATEEELEAFFALMESDKMDEELQEYMQQEAAKADDEQQQRYKRKPWLPVTVAASLLVMASAGLYFYNKNQPAPGTDQLANTKPIVPGSNKAILTLANGQQISLTDAKAGELTAHVNKTASGKIVYDSNGEEMEYHTISTPRGGQWPELVLPDGTKVMLDAASSIKYPVAFTGNERSVEITGQVYFEVKHDKNHPFKVKAGDQLIEDIGTAFNINAYSDEPTISTTLVEGSVRLHKADRQALLKPGQQGLTRPSNQQIKIHDVDIDAVVAWKNGQTSFEGESLPEIMRQISRWYDIDIKYEGEVTKRKFNGGITRKAQLSDLLKILAFQNIHYQLEGRTLIVKP